jgi:hypothetical protein
MTFPADDRKRDDTGHGGETRGLGPGVCMHNPPHPPPKGHPPPIGETGGWGSLAHETQGVPPPDPLFG